MRKISLLFSFLMVLSIGLQAQTMEELKSMQAEKQATIDALTAEVADLQSQIDTYPGWKIGGAGIVGFNLLGNNNWFALANPNSSNTALGIAFSGFANNDREKYFWRNLLNINVNRTATKIDQDATPAVALTNGLDLSSLFGYKIAPKWALSIEAKWLSSLFEFDPGAPDVLFDDEFNFALNSPGQFTISAGVTWTPINNLVVIIHPLGFQQNWPGEFVSSPGAKIGATYAATILPGVSWTSNFSAFLPYSSSDEVTEHLNINDEVIGTSLYDSAGDLFTWDWLNGFSFSVWKGVSVAASLGLRGNKQVADLGRFQVLDALPSNTVNPPAFDFDESPVQFYYTLGLGYTF